MSPSIMLDVSSIFGDDFAGDRTQSFDDFVKTSHVVVPVMLAGLLLPWLVQDSRGIAYSVGAMVCFGIDHFWIGISSSEKSKSEAEAYMLWMFIFNIPVAVFFHVASFTMNASYKDNLTRLRGLPWYAWLSVLAPAAFMILAQTSCQAGFGKDRISSGPNQALVCMDPILVSAFFYMFFDEKLTRVQMMGVVIATCGPVIMSSASSGMAMAAIAWCLAATACYAGNVICIRLAIMHGIDSNVVTVLRMLTIGTLGIAWFAARSSTHGVADVPGPWLCAPCCNAFAQGLGLLYLCQAFASPNCLTAVNCLLFGANSLVMSFLNIVGLAYSPPMKEWLGMSVVIIGCAIVTLGPSIQQSKDGSSLIVPLTNPSEETTAA
eukprot:gnl/TRDRNA2_/TRDRNA2_152465_c0_seq1.p1 gnl/TRDRNA2_/TRDRNA2_152465_c0~~gnl/TRDRNA2_/TRDRNA2_152465_c0_seq1.p1  ORF type:complete len:377 (+),score=47.68 gnl/TRDRNA2_/TRDRNA2_152465_c0_seq1:55-1185(+)